MADREDLLDSLTGNAPEGDTSTDTDPPEDRENGLNNEGDPVDNEGNPGDRGEAESSGPLSGKAATELLDALTDGAKPKEEANPNAPPADDGKEKPDAAPEAKNDDKSKTLDEQEAEALENVKSERGRERIKAVFAERKALEAEKQQLESDIDEFRGMVKATGMNPDQFAQTLEFGRLINTGKEADLRTALQLVDQQREMICKQLGIEAPGVDPLSDFPDLKTAVENVEITKERALELAKHRRAEQATRQRQEYEQHSQQEMQQFKQQIAQLTQTATAYFDTRKKEIDYQPKLEKMRDYLANPDNLNRFLDAHPDPKTWMSALQFMYDNMSVAAPANTAAPTPAPLRSRNANVGAPASQGDVPLANKLMSNIDSMGI